MKDMDKAVDRVKKAIANGEKIMIFGDYDVDGISGTAIMVHTLKALGARVSYRLPHRLKDGYGLSDTFVNEFASVGATLVITVDCGISCKSQIELAKSHGIDVIVTDHHTIPEHFPDAAHAILHPMQPLCPYPFKGLTGAGVAFKFAAALITDKFQGDEREEYLYSLLDLATLGTVADIGPIQDENRIIVKYGLEALKNTKWSGLKFLKEQAGILPDEKLNINTIGFKISPRINAAGRIDHPYYALQLLLLAAGEEERAKMLAAHLEKLNIERQQMVIKAMEEAEQQAANRKSEKIFIAWSSDWHVGILGLIAAKIAEKYKIPCMILQDFGDYLVASARGPEIFHMVEALTAQRHLLVAFGGHAQAAGFNIKKENLPAFVDAMSAYAEEKLQQHVLTAHVTIDCELDGGEINENLLSFLDQMEPFGVANEQPTFLIRGVHPLYSKRVGKEQQHLSFQAQIGSTKLSTIAYRFGEHEPVLRQHQNLDLVCSIERNEWKGRTQIQLRAIDFGASN